MIGIDAGHSLDRLPTGVAVYARNLIHELAAGNPDEKFHWYYRSNRWLRSFSTRMPPNARNRLLMEFALGRSSHKLRLFHGLNQRLPGNMRCPGVATFHDLFVFSGDYSTPEFRERFRHLAQQTASRAGCIIAISQYTAGQVAAFLDFPRELIHVVHHGVEAMQLPTEWRQEEILQQLGIERPYVLHVGALQRRKNIERLVAAFESVDESLQLVLAGSMGYGGEQIEQCIQKSTASKRILLTGHVGNDVRATLYSNAKVLLFPSLEEGFGLPVLEAFSMGLPVITSNSSALPEVSGDAAILVDPLDVEAIAGALDGLLDNLEMQEELHLKGKKRVQQFCWQHCAEQTWQVYEQLATR